MSAALPRIAVTMGDGAGIGPEIIVKALADPHVATMARVVVVGDALRLKQAADIAGVPVDIVTIDDVEQASEIPGRINVIDLALLPEDLPFGQLSAVAGDAAYHYIRVACRARDGGQGAGHLHGPAQQGGAARRRPRLPRPHRAARPPHRHARGLDDALDRAGSRSST